mgnify:CR=1 FL=1
MIDICSIPMTELVSDLTDTIADIAVCQQALDAGVTEYGSHESTAHRLSVNKSIKKQIEAEIERRNLVPSVGK